MTLNDCCAVPAVFCAVTVTGPLRPSCPAVGVHVIRLPVSDMPIGIVPERLSVGAGLPVARRSSAILAAGKPRMSESERHAPDWDPRNEEVLRDPVSAYDAMRERCPVAYSELMQWSVFRHADVARVLGRLGEVAAHERAGYAPAGYPEAPPVVRPMTIDDVVVRTVALLAMTGVAGALTWTLVPDELLGVAWIGGAIVGLVLGLVIAFARITNPIVISAYAIVEGVFVGAVSKFYESAFDGIVLQAVMGTFGVFFIMAILYKARVIRATPKFVKGVLAALVGIFALILMNFVLSLFDINTGLRDGSPLAIGFSIVIIIVAALTFILDFAQIEEGVRYGLPQRYAWACAFGILVGLIWLYLEILRLLSYLRGED